MTCVYHYTTAEGFKGIVESQELWATSIYHLSDWTEFAHGRDALVENAKALLNSRKEGEAAAKLLSFLDNTRPPLFVCSFSAAQDGDDLSQWRAYCPGGGYAIGFPSDYLKAHANTLRFELLECEYDRASTRKAAERFVNVMKDVITMAGGVEKFDRYWSENLSDHGARESLLRLVAQYKHDAFSAEKEHRLVYNLEAGEHHRFRISGSVLVPYVAFSLKAEELWERAKIVMSPCLPDAVELRRESVKAFLQSRLHKHNLPTDCIENIRPSRAPYRTSMGG